MTVKTRSSVLALTEETTEGTLVRPSGATQFLALQDDFDVDPAFDNLENAELKSSIGRSKPIVGAENPSASLSHYFRASGVVGTAPNFGLLLKSVFGSVVAASTEYDTVASSTVGVLKVDSGEGANFQRGQAVMVKDPTNGYRIRCLDSVSTDDLSLGFELPNAPASGVNLGRAVLYKPANEGHPTLSLWHYVGNGGALQAVAGCRVVEASFEMNAGELITGSYSLEGLEYYYNPILIAATDTKLDFTNDDGTFAATITAKEYKSPHDLAAALQTAMNAASTGETATVTYSDSTGKFTIKSTGTVLSLLWNTGANTANTVGDKIGFSTAADDTGTVATTGYTSDNAQSWAAAYAPSYDSADPLVAKDNEVMLGDADDYACLNASTVSVTVGAPKTDKPSVCAVSGKSGSIVNDRVVTVSVTAELSQHEASMFYRFKEGSNVKFQYTAGVKTGGNWVAGKCTVSYSPTMTITSFKVTDQDGVAYLEMELQAYVNSSGEGEFYVNTI